MSKNVLISTGGSGGHVIPAIVFYEHLKDEHNILMSSDIRGIKYFKKENLNLITINTPKISKNIIITIFQIFLIFFLSIKSFFILKNKKIDTLISTGGYMSLPLCIAAKILKIKIILFEPNMVLGRANKLFLGFCKNILCYSKDINNFPSEYKYKISLIYPLIRKNFYNYISKEKNEKNEFNLMIVGGSQGAKIFDTNIKYSIQQLSKKFKIKVCHQTEKNNISQLKDFYKQNNINCSVFDYVDNFIDLLHDADLCVTRAGASTISELIFLEIPFLAIPLPTAKDNHQFENANYYKKKDCCWILSQKEFNKDKLLEILIKIIENKKDYFNKKKNMHNLNFQNQWNNINQKIKDIINEN